MIVTAGKRGFQELNNEIRGLLESQDMIKIEDVNGQRYIGAALDKGKSIEIHGTPGNDTGAYLNGGSIEVFGNGQEAVGNTMGGGSVTIHGHVGDTLGYSMRDGEIFIEKRAGSRAGIHMKEFENMKPVVVIGGTAGAFLGEYMAGGTLIVMGLNAEKNQPTVGAHCATGMHGGRIFIRGKVPNESISDNINVVKELTKEDFEDLEKHIGDYCQRFNADFKTIMSVPFVKLVPATSRPYANLYTPN